MSKKNQTKEYWVAAITVSVGEAGVDICVGDEQYICIPFQQIPWVIEAMQKCEKDNKKNKTEV